MNVFKLSRAAITLLAVCTHSFAGVDTGGTPANIYLLSVSGKL
jgi:hypothetical protein